MSASSLSAIAADHYAIFIDAGSTSSKLHIFSYDDSTVMPNITEAFIPESVKPGISSFMSHPELAGPSLKKLLDDATQYLQKKWRRCSYSFGEC